MISAAFLSRPVNQLAADPLVHVLEAQFRNFPAVNQPALNDPDPAFALAAVDFLVWQFVFNEAEMPAFLLYQSCVFHFTDSP